jgi:hypothetical protein
MIPRVEGKTIAMMIAMMVPPTPRWMRPNPPPPVACSTFLLERPFCQSIALLLARREPASRNCAATVHQAQVRRRMLRIACGKALL